MIDTLRRLNFELRSRVAATGWLRPVFGLYLVWDQLKLKLQGRSDSIQEHLIGPATELVIDGFQGSANSFASDAFAARQQRPVQVAHHLHAPAQIIRAVRRGIPTIVTIREPSGAVLSLTSRWPHISVDQALRSYIRFYRAVQPYADGFVVSPFDDTTRRLDAVIQAVNHRFGTDFTATAPERPSRDLHTRHAVAGKRQQRLRKAMKARELIRPHVQPLLSEAETVYAALLTHVDLDDHRRAA